MVHTADFIRPNQFINLSVDTGGTVKTSANIDFSSKLRQAMGNGMNLASRAASTAAPFVPGASVVSAALNDVGSSLIGAGSAQTVAFPNTGSGGGQNMVQTFQDMQQNMVSTNMQMLSMQRQCQQASEQYTMMSNVMKTRHDAEKNAISNIR